MTLNKEHSTVRRRIERRLRRPVSDAAWAVAEKRGWIAESTDPAYGEGTDKDLAEFLEDLLRVQDHGLSLRAKRSVQAIASTASDRAAVGARVEAISRLAADHAAGDAEILRFRQRILKRDSPMTAAEAEAYLDVSDARKPALTVSSHGTHSEVLDYANLHMSQSIHVWPGSPLDELRKLAADLAKSYPWEPSQAAAFALEGLVPLATPFMIRFPQTWHDRRPHRSRLVMEVDVWMPASEVLAAYREVQRRVLPGHNRPISRRSIDLVNFSMQHRSQTWKQRLERWNNEHANATFPEYRAMRTAYERASRALLMPTYRPYLGPDL